MAEQVVLVPVPTPASVAPKRICFWNAGRRWSRACLCRDGIQCATGCATTGAAAWQASGHSAHHRRVGGRRARERACRAMFRRAFAVVLAAAAALHAVGLSDPAQPTAPPGHATAAVAPTGTLWAQLQAARDELRALELRVAAQRDAVQQLEQAHAAAVQLDRLDSGGGGGERESGREGSRSTTNAAMALGADGAAAAEGGVVTGAPSGESASAVLSTLSSLLAALGDTELARRTKDHFSGSGADSGGGDVQQRAGRSPQKVPHSLSALAAAESPPDHSDRHRHDRHLVRKKDSPETLLQALEHIRVQRLQERLRTQRAQDPTRAEVDLLLANASSSLLPAPAPSPPLSPPPSPSFVWPVECGVALYDENYYGVIRGCSPGWPPFATQHEEPRRYQHEMQRQHLALSTLHARRATADNAGGDIPCRRVAVPGFASAAESTAATQAAARAMVALFHQGGATSLVPDSTARGRLGAAGFTLVQNLRARVKAEVARRFGLVGQLYDSGALLTRLTADFASDSWEMDPFHVYWNAHIDKANIASYDYSALLYLSEHGVDFEGGEFEFIDADADRVVRPRRGMLVAFTSGTENLHRVRKVTAGTRFVLAMWFTCSARHEHRDLAG